MNNNDRKQEAHSVRVSAASIARDRMHPPHVANGDEHKFRTDGGQKPSYLASFTKGMAHCEHTGLVLHPDDFQQFVKAVDTGDPRDFADTPLGPHASKPGSPVWRSDKAKKASASVRAWESQGAGITFDLEGPDAQAVTMPAAPSLGSDELTAEMGEVYAQALLRDVPFSEITDESGKISTNKGKSVTVKTVFKTLNKLAWFQPESTAELSQEQRGRTRPLIEGTNAFRGITPGDAVGPYISQFLLAGTNGVNGVDRVHEPADGYVAYGAIRIDQRVRFATPGDDHMTNWNEWLDVQEGANLGQLESYASTKKSAYRFITTPRDMATYVHYDALYEAYLNACLIMLSQGTPFDPGLPFQKEDYLDHQQGFAHFGGPHILSLVTEVATRALKAVRYQKFNVHRRLRPEVLAARLAKHKTLKVSEIDDMVKDLKPILEMVGAKNESDQCLKDGNYLLPMAFCEGSPMHPSYGAGHATVAGACVTILKAFFDHKHSLSIAGDDSTAFVPSKDGLKLNTVGIAGRLTIEGELNKLASNIAIGRNWAGVHYFTDYIESLRMGEKIALAILEEQKLTYSESFSMTVPLFDGGSVRI